MGDAIKAAAVEVSQEKPKPTPWDIDLIGDLRAKLKMAEDVINLLNIEAVKKDKIISIHESTILAILKFIQGNPRK